MSHAAVGQRSAQRPQWTHTSSSLTISRAVWGSAPEAKMSCFRFFAGALRRVRSSASVPPSLNGAMVRQCTGQTSTQASHSMQSRSVKTVCTSQLRQRSTSRTVWSSVKPISTSTWTDLKRSTRSTWLIFWRWAGL